MQSKFQTIIFQEEFNSNLQNWKLFDHNTSSISIENSNLNFRNISSNSLNVVCSTGNILPPKSQTSFEVEARIKFGEDLDKKKHISLLVGSVFPNEFYKLSFNQNSWIEISERRKKNFFSKQSNTIFFDKRTDFEIYEGYNKVKIEFDGTNRFIKYFINGNFIFNNLYSGLALSHIALECSPGGSLFADSIIVRI